MEVRKVYPWIVPMKGHHGEAVTSPDSVKLFVLQGSGESLWSTFKSTSELHACLRQSESIYRLAHSIARDGTARITGASKLTSDSESGLVAEGIELLMKVGCGFDKGL